MKKQLIENLTKDVYCRIGVSQVQGIGVIAIKKIPEGVNPFKTTRRLKYNPVILSEEDVKHLHPNVRKMLKDYCKTGNSYDCPYNGLNSLDISWYMNHSDKPNIRVVDAGGEFLSFASLRDIEIGEELLIDYRHYE
jgi:SET domain-containing protein